MCTSQSLFPLAAAIQCTGRELLDLNDVSWRRYFQGRLFVECKIVHRLISVPCTESLPRSPTLKSFGLLKASGSQIYCSSSQRQRNLWKAAKVSTGMALEIPLACLFQVLDGAFCLLCACFGMECGKNGAKLDKLFRSPLTFSTTARGKFDRHSSGKSEIHKFSVMAMQNLLAAMRRQTGHIDQQLNRLMQAQIDKNREKMKSIVKTVNFCGQNNIPLRGKRDDNPDDSNL